MVKRKYATISDPKVYRRRTSPDDLERMVAELKGYRTAEVLFRGGEGGVEDSTKKVQEWLKGYPEKSFLGLITNGAVEALADGVNKGQEEEVCEAVWVPLLSLTHLAGDEGYSVCPCLTRYTQAACILLKNTLSFGAIESILPALTVLAQNGTACDYSLAMSSVRTLVVHHLKTGVPNPHMAPLLAHPFTSAPTTDKQQLHEICKTLVAAAVPSQSLVLFLREILGTQAIIDVEGLPCKRGVLGAYTLSLLLLDSDKVAFLADVIAVLPNPEKLVGHLLDKMKAKGVKRHVIDCLKGVLSAPGLTDGMVDIIGTILTENLKEADLLVAAKAFAGVRVLLEVHGEAWHDGAAIAGVMDASFKTLLSTSARLRSASGKTLLLLFRKMPHLAPHDASILIQQALVFLSSLPKPTDLDTNLVETLADVLALPQVSGSLSLVMTIPYDVVKAKYIAKKHRNVESMLSELPDTLWGEAAKYVPQEAYPADTTNANLLWFRAAAEPLIANVDEAVRNVFEGNRLLEARSALKLAAKNHLQWPYKHQFLSYCLQAHPLETLQYIDTLPGTDAREVAYPLLIDLEKRKMYRKLIELLTATVVICKEKWFETAEGKWVTVQDKVEDIEKEEGDPQDEQDNYLKDDQLKREKQGYVKRFAQLAFQNGILSRYATFVSRNIADGGAAECAVQVVKIAPGAVIDQMGHAAVSSLTPITVKVLAECIRNGFPGVKLLSSVLSDPDAEGSLKVSVAEELGGFLLSGQVRDSVDLLVTMSLCVGSLDAKLSGCAIKYIRCHVKSDPHPGQAVVNLFTSLPEKTNVGVALAILAGCPQVASAASSPFVNLLTDSLKAAAEGTPLDTRALDVAEVLAALSHTGHSLGVLYTYLKPLVPEGQDEDHKLPQALIASLLKLVQKQGNEKSGKGNALAELLKQASGKTSGYRKRSHTETKARTNALKEYEIAVASLAKIKKLAEKPLQVEEQSDSSSNSSSNCRDVRTVSRLCDAMSVPSSDYLECFSSGDDTESETDDEERDPTLVRRIVEHPYMEVGVALLIFANCITLALDSPGGDESPVLNGFEYFFTVAFFIEAVLKMMAKGVIHPRRAYLRSNWNKFDFLIIVINVICLVTNVGKNVSSIRTLRVLKALLMVDRTPGLKQMVVATIKSLKSLAHLALLILFIVVIHSIWAVQMWKGTWRYRCVNAEGLLDHTGGCSPNMTSTVSLVMSHECSDGYKCLPVGNPSYGLASFDNFGASVVLIVQCITLSGWSQIMVHTIDANGDFPIFFFGGIVSISNYIVLPLSIIIVKNALHRINTHRPLSQKRTAFRLMRSSLHSAPPTTPSRLSKQVFLEGRKQHKFLIILSFVVPPLLVINVLLMAMVHYKMDRRWEQAIHAFGTAASAFFFLEVVTKFMLLRRSYFSDYFNIFDLILVLLSVISRTVFSGDGSVVIALRVLRLVRVIRLLKSTSVRRQIEGIIGATKKTGYMLLLVLIYTFMVALFLMHMYGSATEAFSSFNKSILASLQVITGDKWGSVMYAVMNDHTPAAAVMFIVFHFLGHFLTTKLFVAVVMEYYEFVQEALATCGTSGRRRRADSRMKKSIKTVERLNHRDQTQRDELVLHIQLAVPHDYRHTPELCDAYMKGVLEASYENHSMVELYMKNEVRGKKLVEAFTRGRGTRESVSRDKLSVLLGWSATLAALTAVQPHEDLDNDENSMFIFPPSVRQHVAWVVKRPWFDRIAIILALLSCITSALGSFYEHEIMVVDYYITGFFFVEMLLKSVAYGFIKGEGAYLKNGWNQFDFMILLVVLLSYVLAPLHISVVKVIRSLRAIRPMRLLKRWKGVKLVALALVRCLPGLLSAFALVSLVLILFAVWGVNIMKGRFGQCTVPYIGAMTDCHGEYFYPDNFTDYTFPEELVINTTEGGFIVTAEWVSRAQHFDHVFAAVRSLLALSTYDNWRAHLELYQSVCFEKSPGQCDPSAAPVVFLLLFLAWNVFFVYPIVTAEVVVIYIEVRKEIEHTADYSVRELAYFYMMKMLFLIKPSYKNSPRDSQLARYCYFVVTHRWFDNIIGVTIVLNIITMATEHEGMPDVLGKMLLVTDTGFTFLFLIEAVLKLSAFGTAYFKESWNRFDFLLVTASMIEFIVFVVMGSNSLPVNPFILRSLRAFLRLRKAQRLLRLVKRTRGIQLLFETLWVALPYLCANAFFYFMTTLVYSIVGVGLFNSVKWTPNGLDTHVNFNNVLSASITLHRVATGDNWAVLMENCMLSPPYCSEEGDTCGYPFAAPVYFITFKGLSYIVIVTLFIATVVDHYTAMTKLGGLTGGMREISILHSVWSEMFSNKETIPAMCLPPLMVEIGKRKSVDYTPKFFLPENYTRLDFFKIFESYQIIDHQGVVHFSSLLLEVAFNQLSKVNGKGITRKEWWSFEYDWYRLVPAIRLPVSRLLWYRYRLRDYFAVVFIQRWYRFLLRLSKMRRLLPLDVAYWKSKRAQPRLERGNTFTKARYRSPTELEKVHEKSLTFPDNVSSVSSYVLSAPTATLATPLLADFAPQFSQLSNPLLSTSHKSGPSSVLL